MAKCVPGMPCYDTIVYRTYPKGCATTEPSPFTLPLASDDLYYSGPNLPYTGIQTEDDITEAIQRIDVVLGTLVAPEVLVAEFIILKDELLTIQATPKVLVSKPGSGKFIKVLRVTQKQITQTTDYSTGGTFTISYAPASTVTVTSLGSMRQGAQFPKNFFATYTTYSMFVDTTTVINQDLVLKNSTVLSADGDTYLKLKIEYVLEDFV